MYYKNFGKYFLNSTNSCNVQKLPCCENNGEKERKNKENKTKQIEDSYCVEKFIAVTLNFWNSTK